jgi:Cft2 family RNA processing exonuclease
MLEVRFEEGVELPGLGLWLDPRRRKEMAFVSHAHSDHLGAHAGVILTRETSALMRARLHGKRSEQVLAFEEAHSLGTATLRLLPAGHITGSAQIHVESEEGSLLYTGDFKLRPSRSAEACRWRQADTLIMETTFALPRYVFPPQNEVEAAVIAFCHETLASRATPVLLVYSLGKAQELIWTLLENGLSPRLHPVVYRMTEICRELQPNFPEGYTLWDPECGAGGVVVMPPGRRFRPLLQSIQPYRTAVLTGWALNTGARFRYQCDAAFPWSDHAGYPDLLRYVELVRPRQVLTLHGFAAEFARDLRARGISARALSQQEQLEFVF